MLIGAERERPYERPPLSKDYLRGEAGREKIYVHDEGFYAEHDIELRLGAATAVDLDTAAREVALDDGERLRYDRLLLATGAEPRRLPIPGAELDGVLYLRSVDDSDALRARLDRGGRVVVIGAGWIGAEVAASARQRGLEVTVIEPHGGPARARARPRGRRHLPRRPRSTTACEMLLGHGRRGRSRATARSSASGPATAARSSATSSSSASASQPRTELAAQAGLAVDNGILVDEHLQTSAPGVFAAGDVANARHPFYGERVRVEHWANALHQGPLAAPRHARPRRRLRPPAVLLLRPVRRRHGVLRLRARRGTASCSAATPPTGSSSPSGSRDDRVVAGMNVNVWDVTDPIRR